MATLIRKRGRRPLAAGKIAHGYVNANYPNMVERAHWELQLGDYILRIGLQEFETLKLDIATLEASFNNGRNRC